MKEVHKDEIKYWYWLILGALIIAVGVWALIWSVELFIDVMVDMFSKSTADPNFPMK